jgi:uncharacterized RmlC-like cupin family protein
LESVLYVINGQARVRWGQRLEFLADAGPGDFIYIPSFVPHQEIDPSTTEVARCVVIRSGQDPIVINLDIDPMASVVHDRLLTLLARGGGGLDWSAVAKVAAEDAGLPSHEASIVER